jgi:hypothetical protein
MAAPLGQSWLAEHFGITSFQLGKRFEVGGRAALRVEADVEVEVLAAKAARPGDPFAHLEFAARYEALSLALLKQVFERLDAASPGYLGMRIAAKPTGLFARRCGALYELLTGRTLDVVAGGRYETLLDPAHHVTSAVCTRLEKWKLIVNLPGDANYCPVIANTTAIQALRARNWQEEFREIVRQFPAELFARATQYLYSKETKSSFQIERESAENSRGQRFLAALREAGQEDAAFALAEPRLVGIQRGIVQSRVAAASFRTEQNYLGETVRPGYERVHYICPPPELVYPLIAGLQSTYVKLKDLDPVIAAGCASFGFVFIHPFEDGNGRLHRYLIHDVLARAGLFAPGVIVPVSARMESDRASYDRALEAYSRRVMACARYQLDDQMRLTLLNPSEVEPLYRYPDLTEQVAYTGRILEQSLTQDLIGELQFLVGYDRSRQLIDAKYDLRARELDLLLRLISQNSGQLAKGKRVHFAMLSDAEIAEIESIVRLAFLGSYGSAA